MWRVLQHLAPHHQVFCASGSKYKTISSFPVCALGQTQGHHQCGDFSARYGLDDCQCALATRRRGNRKQEEAIANDTLRRN